MILVGPLGLPGIALAIAIAAWLEAVALIVILWRRLAHFDPLPLVRVGLAAAGASLIASAASLGAVTLTETWFGTDLSKLALLVQIGIVSAVFGAVYLGISLVLRVPELPSIVGVMVDALRPRRS